MSTTHATVTEIDDDAIVFDEIVVSTPETGVGGDSRRRRHVVSTIALIAAGAAAFVASASLVQRTTSGPDPTSFPAAISPSDATLGYLLSDDFPDISIGPLPVSVPSPPDLILGYLLSDDFPDISIGPLPVSVPSPPDLILGYLLSDDFPDITSGRDRTQDPLAFSFSANGAASDA